MTVPVAAAPYLVVASLAKRDPMCALFFTHLAGRAPLRIVQHPADGMAGPLSGASGLVIIRGLFEFGNLPACARRLGVPVYYFLDDNFMLIRNEGGNYGRPYERYTDDRVRDALRGYDGVWLAAPTLVDYFAEHALHGRLDYYPPVAGPLLTVPARTADHPLTIAFFGGLHRRAPFIDFVYPAIRRLAAVRPVRLVAAGIERSVLPADGAVEVVCPPYDTSYTAALQVVADLGVDILVHPSNETANNIYKNPHVLINARAIGAVPIFTREAPYAGLAGTGVAALCDNTETSWFDALTQLSDGGRRECMRQALERFCQTHFSGATNLALIGDVLRAHGRPAPAARLARRLAGAACLAAGRLGNRIDSRVARWQARM
ncbi:MAG: hypothetical protein AB7L71_01880 [Vicinamibacterales bacterium]